MKGIILNLFDLITWLPIWLRWPSVKRKLESVWHSLYSSYISHQLKRSGRIKLASSHLHLCGLQHMEWGNEVELHFDARVECIDHYPRANQTFTPRLILHDNVIVQAMCHIGCINHVEIGEWTTMGARCYITDHTHGGITRQELDLPPRYRPLLSKGPVIIGHHVHIGEGACIMPGVTVGDHSVIGAGAVVTRSIPPYSIAVGSPAKVIKQIN
ncbi:MAG: acyltransferase [Bacteroidales bacterium]|nr:acyltransferase [Bacteroidales bacterium]